MTANLVELEVQLLTLDVFFAEVTDHPGFNLVMWQKCPLKKAACPTLVAVVGRVMMGRVVVAAIGSGLPVDGHFRGLVAVATVGLF